MNNPASRWMNCVRVSHACVEVRGPQPYCSSSCADPPIRVSIHGPHAESDRSHLLRRLKNTRDPLNDFALRHLERVVTIKREEGGEGDALVPPRAKPRTELPHGRMVWVRWEAGFADQILKTLLPVARDLLNQTTRSPLMISGTLFPDQWRVLDEDACTFERHDRVQDSVVSNPLPRCRSRCLSALDLCRTIQLGHRYAYDTQQMVDRRLLRKFPLRAHRAESNVTAVVFAVRKPHNAMHTRDIMNVDSLVRGCDAFSHRAFRLRCEAVAFADLNASEVVHKMRGTDILVCMNGGDCVHGMHLAKGGAVVETVNRGFHRAPGGWLNLYRRSLTPSLVHKRVVLCGPDLSVVDAWNRRGVLPQPLFHKAIASVLDGAEGDIVCQNEA